MIWFGDILPAFIAALCSFMVMFVLKRFLVYSVRWQCWSPLLFSLTFSVAIYYFIKYYFFVGVNFYEKSAASVMFLLFSFNQYLWIPVFIQVYALLLQSKKALVLARNVTGLLYFIGLCLAGLFMLDGKYS